MMDASITRFQKLTPSRCVPLLLVFSLDSFGKTREPFRYKMVRNGTGVVYVQELGEFYFKKATLLGKDYPRIYHFPFSAG